MKWCPTSLVISETQTKTTMRYQFTSTRRTIKKTKYRLLARMQGCWSGRAWLGGMEDAAVAVKSRLNVPQKVKHSVTVWSSNSSRKQGLKQFLVAPRSQSAIHNSQKVGTTQTSINRWINIVYTCHGILFGHKKGIKFWWMIQHRRT